MASPASAGGAILLSGMVPAVWIEQTTYRLQGASYRKPVATTWNAKRQTTRPIFQALPPLRCFIGVHAV